MANEHQPCSIEQVKFFKSNYNTNPEAMMVKKGATTVTTAGELGIMSSGLLVMATKNNTEVQPTVLAGIVLESLIANEVSKLTGSSEWVMIQPFRKGDIYVAHVSVDAATLTTAASAALIGNTYDLTVSNAETSTAPAGVALVSTTDTTGTATSVKVIGRPKQMIWKKNVTTNETFFEEDAETDICGRVLIKFLLTQCD